MMLQTLRARYFVLMCVLLTGSCNKRIRWICCSRNCSRINENGTPKRPACDRACSFGSQRHQPRCNPPELCKQSCQADGVVKYSKSERISTRTRRRKEKQAVASSRSKWKLEVVPEQKPNQRPRRLLAPLSARDVRWGR